MIITERQLRRLIREYVEQEYELFGPAVSHLMKNPDFLVKLAARNHDVRRWFGDNIGTFQLGSANCFENKAPDHVAINTINGQPRIELEMTLCMWRNHFTCDILAEKGTAHIESLCKWGPSTFTYRKRVFPSGRPPETQVILTQSDPTWASEYTHFKERVASGKQTDLSTDMWLLNHINRLSRHI